MRKLGLAVTLIVIGVLFIGCSSSDDGKISASNGGVCEALALAYCEKAERCGSIREGAVEDCQAAERYACCSGDLCSYVPPAGTLEQVNACTAAFRASTCAQVGVPNVCDDIELGSEPDMVERPDVDVMDPPGSADGGIVVTEPPRTPLYHECYDAYSCSTESEGCFAYKGYTSLCTTRCDYLDDPSCGPNAVCNSTEDAAGVSAARFVCVKRCAGDTDCPIGFYCWEGFSCEPNVS